jgi:hypothetical protein
MPPASQVRKTKWDETMPKRYLPRFTATAALLTSYLLAAAALAATADNPEPGKQGETMAGEARKLDRPYSRGVNVVGNNPLDGRTGNLDMTWSGHCAYVASGAGFSPMGALEFLPHSETSGTAVIDVSDPAAPRLVRYLRDKGAIDATETLHAVALKGRAILATSTYGGVAGMNSPKEGWLSVHDVSDCANPRLLAEVQWPEPVHTLAVSPDARLVYGTNLNPFTGAGGISVMDISNPAQPRFLGKFRATGTDGKSFAFAPHALTFSRDGRRIYVGVNSSHGHDLDPDVLKGQPGAMNFGAVGRDAGGVYIFDNSDFVRRKADPKLRLIGTAPHAGWHSPVPARISGKPYLVSAGELGACPGAWPRITSIINERKPERTGEFRLAMNRPENCPEPNGMEKGSGGLVGRAGTASSHFQEVDNSANTRLGMFGFLFAGMRIADLRDPSAPAEIAYFKPGDPCASRARYVPRTGHIWFACNTSGFWVIELKPELRRTLRLPPIRRGR